MSEKRFFSKIILLIIISIFISYNIANHSVLRIFDLGSYSELITFTLPEKVKGLINYSQFTHKVNERMGQLTEERKTKKEKQLKYFMPYIAYGDPHQKSVALTFDDGPHPGYTTKLLKLLEKNKIRATFFVVGKMAEKYPDLLREIYKNGHTIGNHTYHHYNLQYLKPHEVEKEWHACNKVVESILGVDMFYCRPPGGSYDDKVVKCANNLGLSVVLWTINPGDYLDYSKELLLERFYACFSSGGIILLHDGGLYTLEILPIIIKDLKKKGYKFITIDEMAMKSPQF